MLDTTTANRFRIETTVGINPQPIKSNATFSYLLKQAIKPLLNLITVVMMYYSLIGDPVISGV